MRSNNNKNSRFDKKQQMCFLETTKWHRHKTHAAIASLCEIEFSENFNKKKTLKNNIFDNTQQM